MSKERLYLFDTTLRDGQQTPGIDFSVEDKILVANLLDQLGVDYVEGGYPGANPTDTRVLRREADAPGEVHRLRHGEARRVARSRTIRDCRICSAPRPTRSASSPRPGTSTSSSRSIRTNEEVLEFDRAVGRGVGRGGPRDAARLRALLRRLQVGSRLCALLRRDGAQVRRALGRALRHQWRHAARRGGDDRRRLSWRASAATGSASTRTTIRGRRWRTRSPRCEPARDRSRGR